VGPLVHPALNDVETLSSSANDLVSFFSRALQGRIFAHPETLEQFRRILLLGDITYLVPFPPGASVFGKAGYFDSPGDHGRCIAGVYTFRIAGFTSRPF
jgi:beta-lactamase class A